MSLFAADTLEKVRAMFPAVNLDLIVRKIEARYALKTIRYPESALLAYCERAVADGTERLDAKGSAQHAKREARPARTIPDGGWIAAQRANDWATAAEPDYAAFRGALVQRVLAESLTPSQVGEILREYQYHFAQIADAELSFLAASGETWRAYGDSQ
jgi:hypothetical protein